MNLEWLELELEWSLTFISVFAYNVYGKSGLEVEVRAERCWGRDRSPQELRHE